MALQEKIVITATNRTAKAFKDVERDAKRSSAALAGLATAAAGIAAAGVLAAGALFLLTKRAVENADAIAKAADKVGLSVESLQELRYAAELAGVETKTLDMAMQRFSRRVGEAAQGQGELRATLEQYNIAVKDSEGNARALDDVLNDYVDTIFKAESQQEKLRLAFKAFDSEGAALVNMFKDGSAGLQEFRDEAQRLGLVLSEDAVRGAEAANDALLRMEKILSVNLQKVLLQFAPQITALGQAFADAAPQIAKFADQVIGAVFGLEAMSIQGLRQELYLLTKAEQERSLAVKERGATHIGAIKHDIEQIRVYEKQKTKLEELIATGEKRETQLQDMFKPGGAGAGDEAAAAAAEKAAAAERTRAEALLLAIEETNLQVMGREAELLDMRVEQELAKLIELHEAKTISEMEFLEAEGAIYMTALVRKQELAAAAEAEITANQKAESDKREKAAKDLADAELRARRGLHAGLSAIAALQNVQSRKMFEVGKAAAASLALVKTYEGAQAVFASAAQVPYVGWILAPIAAAAAVVSGLANVQAIMSTSYGGGGGGGRGGGGGVSMPPAPSPDVPSLAPPSNDAQVPTTIFLNFDSESGMVSTEWLRDEFFPKFNEAIGDGVNVVAS
jgi:hypothetical protein